MILLKTIGRPIVIVFLFVACTQSAGKKQPVEEKKIDSSNYYPPAPANLPKTDFRKYYKASKAFYDTMLAASPNFSGSFLVAKNGVVVFAKTQGFFNTITQKDSLTSRSPFHIASVSKTFTAMAILQLMEKGLLKLDDDLSIYFDKFPYPGTTIKMLLSHRSGLPNYVHYLDRLGWDKKKMVSNQDVLQSLYTMHPPLSFKTGTHFSYCNTNYALLALIIEKVSGKTYPNFMKETFFVPLQMNDTYVYTHKDSSRAMPSTAWNNRPYNPDFLDEVYGDKNIYSTTNDILKWDQALYSDQFFKPSTLDSAFAGYSFEKQGKRNYGLGWRITFLDNGKKLIYHNGWWHGNNATFIRLLDEKATIIVLGNRFTSKIYKARKLCDAFGDYGQNTKEAEENDSEDSSGKKDSTSISKK
jgi:CubicO group peptidase (beta-lactamase class C family)